MTQIRKDALRTGEVYHIYTRSIAKFIVFNNDVEYARMLRLFQVYCYEDFNFRFSQFLELTDQNQQEIIDRLRENGSQMVQIISYCLMPTHIHLILKQTASNGISRFMALVLNSYSRFFNTYHRRTGPLWSSRFKNTLVVSDNQLLHLTRYIHLNPTSAGLVQCPEDWGYSSYDEFLKIDAATIGVCSFEDLLDIKPQQYQKFVNDQKSYQHQLAIIKSLTIDDYTG
jgi:putative transposase